MVNLLEYLQYTLWDNTVQSIIISLFIVLLFIGLGKLFSLFIVSSLKRVAAKTKMMFDDILINVLEKPLVFALFIAGFSMATARLNLSERMREITTNINEILVMILIIWVIIKFLDAVIEHYLKPVVSKSSSHLDKQLLPFAKTTVKIIIIVIGLIFIIRDFGYDVTSLVAGLGIGGLAFALAAQPLLTNLFGGIAIISDKPFKIGDRIRIDDRYEGYVMQIGMRSTTIKSPRSTIIRIPNSVIAATALENLSRLKDHAVRTVFNIGITYNTPAEKVKEAIEIIRQILEKHPNVISDDPDFNYFVGFNEFRDSSLNIVVGYSYPPEIASKVRTEVNLEIKEKFEAAGIEFAFNTQTVYVKKEE